VLQSVGRGTIFDKIIKLLPYLSIHTLAFLDFEPVAHIEQSVTTFVHWDLSARLSDCCHFLGTVTLFNKLCREKWEMEGKENISA
jgi:hypothetical protein